jgi:hypothetical protein
MRICSSAHGIEMKAVLDEMMPNDHPENGTFRIVKEDVIRWAVAESLTLPDFYEKLALYLAKEYHQGRLSFEICDAIVNDLWVVILHEHRGEFKIPEMFYEVFSAFDEGEYHHSKDKSDDPISDYTDPWIAEILEKFLD